MGSTLSTLQPNSNPNVSTNFLKPLQLKTTDESIKIEVELIPRKNLPALNILVHRFHSSANISRPKPQTKESIERSLITAISIKPSRKSGPLSHHQIIDYINNTQESQHPFGIQVEDIIYVRQSVEPNFEQFLKQNGAQGTRRMLLWHGTHLSRVLPILEDGFKMPKYNAYNKRLQGQGLYFADRASKSAQYCDPNMKPSPGQPGCLLLCDVLLGNVMYSTQPDNARSIAPDNYHSVACPGKWIPSPDQNLVVEQSQLGSLVVPMGKTMDNPKPPTSNIKFNEFIVFSTEQIKVVYLVFFTFTSDKYNNCIK